MIEKKFEFGKNYIVFDYKIKKLQEGSASKAEFSVADDSFDITLSLYNADNVKINETSVMLPLDTLIESASLDYENKKIILNTVNSEPIECDISELIDSITSLDNLKADRTELEDLEDLVDNKYEDVMKKNNRFARVSYHSTTGWCKVAEVAKPSDNTERMSAVFMINGENNSSTTGESWFGIAEWNIHENHSSSSFKWLAAIGFSENNFNIRYVAGTDKVSLWVLPSVGIMNIELLSESTNGVGTYDIELFDASEASTREGVSSKYSEYGNLKGLVSETRKIAGLELKSDITVQALKDALEIRGANLYFSENPLDIGDSPDKLVIYEEYIMPSLPLAKRGDYLLSGGGGAFPEIQLYRFEEDAQVRQQVEVALINTIADPLVSKVKFDELKRDLKESITTKQVHIEDYGSDGSGIFFDNVSDGEPMIFLNEDNDRVAISSTLNINGIQSLGHPDIQMDMYDGCFQFSAPEGLRLSMDNNHTLEFYWDLGMSAEVGMAYNETKDIATYRPGDDTFLFADGAIKVDSAEGTVDVNGLVFNNSQYISNVDTPENRIYIGDDMVELESPYGVNATVHRENKWASVYANQAGAGLMRTTPDGYNNEVVVYDDMSDMNSSWDGNMSSVSTHYNSVGLEVDANGPVTAIYLNDGIITANDGNNYITLNRDAETITISSTDKVMVNAPDIVLNGNVEMAGYVKQAKYDELKQELDALKPTEWEEVWRNGDDNIKVRKVGDKAEIYIDNDGESVIPLINNLPYTLMPTIFVVSDWNGDKYDLSVNDNTISDLPNNYSLASCLLTALLKDTE